MKEFLLVAASAVVCFSSGCTKYWYQEGKTFAECRQDLQLCRSEMKRYRDNVQYDLDVYDIRFEKDCMTTRGYRLVKEKELPLRVKREGPATSRGEKFGVAGALEEP